MEIVKIQSYSVYAIKSAVDGRIYVGMTSNLSIRLKWHNAGYERSTKAYCPWVLVYREVCADRQSARQREKYWKSGTGKEKLKKMTRRPQEIINVRP